MYHLILNRAFNIAGKGLMRREIVRTCRAKPRYWAAHRCAIENTLELG